MSDGITRAYRNMQTLTFDPAQETWYTKQIWAEVERLQAALTHATPGWTTEAETMRTKALGLARGLIEERTTYYQNLYENAVKVNIWKERLALDASYKAAQRFIEEYST